MDLKAELYRKQEQFKQDKLGHENTGAGFTSRAKVKVHYVVFVLGPIFTCLFNERDLELQRLVDSLFLICKSTFSCINVRKAYNIFCFSDIFSFF